MCTDTVSMERRLKQQQLGSCYCIRKLQFVVGRMLRVCLPRVQVLVDCI